MATTSTDPITARSPALAVHVPGPNGELDDARRELLQAQIRLARAKVAVIDAAAEIKMLRACFQNRWNQLGVGVIAARA